MSDEQSTPDSAELATPDPTTDRPGVPMTRDERVRFIAQQMSEDEWPAGAAGKRHRRALAEQWGCAEATIRDYAAEAHRIIALDPEQREALRARIALRMREIHDDAMENANRVTGLPDYGSAIKALESHAKFSGVDVEQKIKLSGSLGVEGVQIMLPPLDDDGGNAEDT